MRGGVLGTTEYLVGSSIARSVDSGTRSLSAPCLVCNIGQILFLYEKKNVN